MSTDGISRGKKAERERVVCDSCNELVEKLLPASMSKKIFKKINVYSAAMAIFYISSVGQITPVTKITQVLRFVATDCETRIRLFLHLRLGENQEKL